MNSVLPHNPLEGDRPEMAIDLQSGIEEQISIIIVHKDTPDYLNILLQSITVTSQNNNYEIIVVDNNSGSEGQFFLDDIQDKVKVIRNNKNLYWSEAANIGAKEANKNSKYLLFMHADVVILKPEWIDLMIGVSVSQKSGLVGVELNHYILQGQKVDFIQEWCMLVTRECWKEAGPFPESLPQVGPSFILTMKAQKAGYAPQAIKNPVCHHYRIFGININEYERITEQAQIEIPKIIRELQTISV